MISYKKFFADIEKDFKYTELSILMCLGDKDALLKGQNHTEYPLLVEKMYLKLCSIIAKNSS